VPTEHGPDSVVKEVKGPCLVCADSTCFATYAHCLVENQPIQTPSTHRQRLNSNTAPAPRTGLINLQPHGISNTPMPHQTISPIGRQTTSVGGTGFAGYGMSAGMKVSNPAGSVANGLERPVNRSRGLLPIYIRRLSN
jgi:hypothetical protein